MGGMITIHHEYQKAPFNLRVRFGWFEVFFFWAILTELYERG